ncbi:MAG TPA: hypothetical protein VH350_19695 [Candidatus Sulfotelmatobacter sp.]|jgi:hypothetical protein|nr:hypothetical protein [Candidatus Sulfotelmatobacter sp.]
MTARLSSVVLLATLLALPAHAKDKKKSTLPEYVLRATTVRVVVNPEAGEPINEPMANANARAAVEKALMEWGRLEPVMDGQESDLVIAVRTGNSNSVRPTIKGGPIDQRPGTAESTDSTVRIGAQQGTPPPLNDPGMGPQMGPQNSPRITNEVGASEDTFEVYRGGQYPLDSPPVWRLIAKDCLREPGVTAVEEFRKAIAKAEQARLSKKP